MKKVRDKIYIHSSYEDNLEDSVRGMVERAKKIIPEHFKWNILRINTQTSRIGFLFYPEFISDPHPTLVHAITVDLTIMRTKYYEASKTNPPILHRKESFLHPNHENYQIFSKLTEQEEKAGLLEKSILHLIGHKIQWEELLKSKGFRIVDHRLQAATEVKET